MKPGWEESEYVVCDLQEVVRYLKPHDDRLPRRFLESAYDTFEFLAHHPTIGRPRPDLGFENLRSWHVLGFRRILVFYRELPGCVQIWRVLHGARDLQSIMRPEE